MTRTIVRTAFASALAGAAIAAPPGGATGTFSFRTATVKIVDAYAYRAAGSFGDEPVIAVRLSTVPLDHAAVDKALDRSAALAAAAAQSPSILLEFDPKGDWRGASYSLGGSNACGYCSGPMSAPGVQVKLAGGALRGPMKVKAADYGKDPSATMDLVLDVKVAEDVATTPLPAGGGEPGLALAGCLAAVQKKDVAGFRKHCAPADEPALAEAEKGGGLDGFWEYGLYGHQALKLKTLTVKGGGVAGDQAFVVVEGKGEDASYKGTAYLRKTATGWRFDHDALKAVY